MCLRTHFRALQRSRMSENPALEGRPSLAQRFSAGKSGRNDSSRGGTTEFSAHTLKGLGASVIPPRGCPGLQSIRSARDISPKITGVADASATAPPGAGCCGSQRNQEQPGTENYFLTARSVISSPRSIIANASRSCCSLMHSGGLV